MTLERRGYRVMLASDGMQALARLNEVKPDLVLLDIDMPQIDGYQLCKLIKNNEATRGVHIVMLTGKDGFFDKIRAGWPVLRTTFTKPFEPNYWRKSSRSTASLRFKK
jgi:twitching motility two-component system response regulator PilG